MPQPIVFCVLSTWLLTATLCPCTKGDQDDPSCRHGSDECGHHFSSSSEKLRDGKKVHGCLKNKPRMLAGDPGLRATFRRDVHTYPLIKGKFQKRKAPISTYVDSKSLSLSGMITTTDWYRLDVSNIEEIRSA